MYSDIDIMVSGFALSALGFNLHHIYAKAIAVQLTWNSNTIIQAARRSSFDFWPIYGRL